MPFYRKGAPPRDILQFAVDMIGEIYRLCPDEAERFIDTIDSLAADRVFDEIERLHMAYSKGQLDERAAGRALCKAVRRIYRSG